MSPNTLTESEARDLAVRALLADRPAEVTTIIKQIESQYDVSWRPLGDTQNNHGTVELQADSPTACLVELIYNEFDAELMKAFLQNTPTGAEYDDYPTVKDALKQLDPDADVELVLDGSETRKGDDIWSPIIRGTGIGQTKDDAFDTFLGLNSPGKAKKNIPFVQGQFGMGATGVLKHSGNEFEGIPAYKFIASASVEKPGEWWWTVIRFNDQEGQYEHFLIDGDLPAFTGEFGGELMESFLDDYEKSPTNFTQFDPQEYGSFVKVYDYQMDTARGQVSASEGFVRKLERYLVEPPFPLRITELRYSKMKAPQTTTQGFLAVLDKPGMQPNILHRESFPHTFSDERLGTRTIDIALFHEEEQNSKKSNLKGRVMQRVSSETGIHSKHAVMFTVNGQTHGDLGLGFLKNQCSFSKIATDLVVIVRFDHFPHTRLSKLFNPSRERLADSPLASLLKEELKEVLTDLDVLQEEEDNRRASRSGEEADLDSSFEELFDANPEFVQDLNSGTVEGLPGVTRPTVSTTAVEKDPDGTDVVDVDDEEEDDDIPRLPTYFELLETYDPAGEHVVHDGPDRMAIEMPLNKRQKVRFATDAPYDFLTRDDLQGSLCAAPEVLYNAEPRDGIWTVTLEPYTAFSPSEGDEHPVSIKLMRPSVDADDIEDINGFDAVEDLYRDKDEALPVDVEGNIEYHGPEDDDEFEQKIVVKYTAEVEETTGSPSTNTTTTGVTGTTDGSKTGKKIQPQVQYPDPHLVYRQHWDEELNDDGNDKYSARLADEFDEHTLISVSASRDGTVTGLDVTVNMDANALRSFIIRQNIQERFKKEVEMRYLRAVIYEVIALFHKHKHREEEVLINEESDIGHADYIQQAINDQEAVIMLNLYGKEELNHISE